MAMTLFTQGPLRVLRVDHGFVIEHDDVVVRLRADGTIEHTDIAATPAARQRFDAVVVVVAEAIQRHCRGAFHIHAGTVAHARGVLLIAGEAGAGKTTTTLALEAAGALRCGDDVAFLRTDDRRVLVKAWVRPLHVGHETLQMFPGLDVAVGASLAGKAVVDAGGDDAERPVVALVFPRIVRSPTTTTTATRLLPLDVLPRLLKASAMVMWPTLPHTQQHLDVLGRLAALPAVAVTLGADALRTPLVIANVVERALWPT